MHPFQNTDRREKYTKIYKIRIVSVVVRNMSRGDLSVILLLLLLPNCNYWFYSLMKINKQTWKYIRNIRNE